MRLTRIIKGAELGLAVALLSSRALADDVPRPDVEALSAHGDGCPPGTAFATLARAPDGQWNYDIILTSFHAATSDESSSASRECHVETHVFPPQGYRMRVASMLLQGKHVTPGDASTRLGGDYAWWIPGTHEVDVRHGFSVEPAPGRPGAIPISGAFRVTSAENLASVQGNWGVTYEEMEVEWTGCRAAVTLTSDLTLTAHRGSRGEDAEIGLQRSGVGLSWGWKFERCGGESSFFDGHWVSTYVAATGELVRAAIDIEGDHGTYRTPHFTGRLFDIRAGGDRVRGKWAALRDEGWFDFEVNGGSFSGSWGTSSDGSARGAWWGHRGEDGGGR